jgi:hypothetical protein
VTPDPFARLLRDLRDDLAAARQAASDVYCAVERSFERIAVVLDGLRPSGADLHARLLDQMGAEVSGVRPPVVSAELRPRIDELMRFRHLSRHMYAFNLEWARMTPLLRELPATVALWGRDLDSLMRLLEAAGG